MPVNPIQTRSDFQSPFSSGDVSANTAPQQIKRNVSSESTATQPRQEAEVTKAVFQEAQTLAKPSATSQADEISPIKHPASFEEMPLEDVFGENVDGPTKIKVGGKDIQLGSLEGAQVEVKQDHRGEWRQANGQLLAEVPNTGDQFVIGGLRGGGNFMSRRTDEDQAIGSLPAPVPAPNAPANSRAHQLFAAAVTQTVSTGLTFGIKPFVEAAVEQTLIAMGGDKVPVGDTVHLAKLLSNVAGGAFVGAIHSPVSASVGAFVAHQTGAPSFRDTGDTVGGRELRDVASVTLPVFAAFTGTFAAGRAISAQLPQAARDNIWVQATARAIQSDVGGFIQGAITAAVKMAMSDSFEQSQSGRVEPGEIATRFRDTINNQFRGEDFANKFKNGFGKVLGSTFGMVAATYTSPATVETVHNDLGGKGEAAKNSLAQAASGAASMMAYLSCWFFGIHTGSLSGQKVNADRAAQAVQAEQAQQQLQSQFDASTQQVGESIAAVEARVQALSDEMTRNFGQLQQAMADRSDNPNRYDPDVEYTESDVHYSEQDISVATLNSVTEALNSAVTQITTPSDSEESETQSHDAGSTGTEAGDEVSAEPREGAAPQNIEPRGAESDSDDSQRFYTPTGSFAAPQPGGVPQPSSPQGDDEVRP